MTDRLAKSIEEQPSFPPQDEETFLGVGWKRSPVLFPTTRSWTHWMLLSMLANQAVFSATNPYTWPVVLRSGCRRKSLILGLVTRTSRAGDLRDHRRPGVTLEPRSLNTLLDDPYPHIRFGDARSKVDELAEDDSFDGAPFGCDCHWVASRNSVDDELDLF